MLRRFIICTIPIDHINGKLCRTEDVCHNQADTDVSDITFYYGYRHQFSKKSCFGYREKARNLSKKPYTQAEQANKDKFRRAVSSVSTARTDPQTWSIIINQWRKNGKYATVQGYAMAMALLNGGELPTT